MAKTKKSKSGKGFAKFASTSENMSLNNESAQLMPRDLVKEFRAFVFEGNKDKVKIAAVDPHDPSLKAYAEKQFKEVQWFVAEEKDVSEVLKTYPVDFAAEIESLVAAEATPDNANLAKLVNHILEHAFARKASDIHIEPERTETVVRFRVDGTLHKVAGVPRKMHQALAARFKIMANLKFDEYRRPQDGRIEPEEFPGTSFRISTVPTLFGEKIALRILNDTNQALTLEELGLREKEREILLENIQKPHGLIVTSGPTGSGKTTTLYSLLQALNKDGLNVSTLEDPIEYTLGGVNQIQINPRVELTFASGLRSLLRQDPDIMMVGEIRDSETALMAANAAMTGHLVLTTMHTNDAASAFTRFIEMKVEDFVVSSTVNLVIAQRLVRQVCTNCTTRKKLDPVILSKLKERTDIIDLLEKKEKGSSKKLSEIKFAMGAGCETCLDSGYNGRLGIFEFIVPSKKIQDIILKRGSSDEIKAAAEEKGFSSMVEDGVGKVLEGKTTFEEIMRTTKSQN